VQIWIYITRIHSTEFNYLFKQPPVVCSEERVDCRCFDLSQAFVQFHVFCYYWGHITTFSLVSRITKCFPPPFCVCVYQKGPSWAPFCVSLMLYELEFITLVYIIC
jgi:hypothetical protein